MRVKAWGHEPESPCGNKTIKSETPEPREGWREPRCVQELLIFLDKSIMMWNRSHAVHRVQGSFSCDFSWHDRFAHKLLFFFFFKRKRPNTVWRKHAEMWFVGFIWLSEGMVKQIKLSRETKAVNNGNWKADLIRQVGQFSAWLVLRLDTHYETVWGSRWDAMTVEMVLTRSALTIHESCCADLTGL